MEVNLFVESLRFLVLSLSTFFVVCALMIVLFNVQAKIIMKYLGSIHINNSTLGLLQNGNFAVVAAGAASIKS